MSQQKEPTRQTGNIVTLTLLGLSVAILAGVVVLYFIGKSKPEPVYTPEPVDEEVFDDNESIVKNEREGWNAYTNERYDFTLEFPDGWVVATGTLRTGDPAISVYKATGTTTEMVFGQDDEVSHVSVYPHGIATEGIHARMKASEVIIEVPQASAKDYILKTGRAWATRGVFDMYPENWTAAGFIFARTKIEEEELVYMRGDTEIDQITFDPFAGDHVERTGFIDMETREVQENILRSFQFISREGEEREQETEPVVILENPVAGAVVSSPLLVEGTTQKGWYFGDDFMVQLVSDDGELITELSVIPQDEGVDETLRFEVSLVYGPTTATSGKLIIGNTNLPQEISEESVTVIPVMFATENISENE